jgi:hypothetical protein
LHAAKEQLTTTFAVQKLKQPLAACAFGRKADPTFDAEGTSDPIRVPELGIHTDRSVS